LGDGWDTIVLVGHVLADTMEVERGAIVGHGIGEMDN
tara:strand:- start:501 stop:611 length:111 start_codon:yes stop_codon:yes gene_type:complete